MKGSGARNKLPAFEESLAAIMLGAKESVLAPMRPKLRDYNITEPQWRVLRVLGERGETDAGVLAKVGMLHVPSVTRILKDLEDRNLIVRQPNIHDRRRIIVGLSPEGRELVKEVSRYVRHYMRRFNNEFGAERLANLTSELKALSATLSKIE